MLTIVEHIDKHKDYIIQNVQMPQLMANAIRASSHVATHLLKHSSIIQKSESHFSLWDY